MSYRYFIPALLLVLTGCLSNNKGNNKPDSTQASIHKVWEFKTVKPIDSASKIPGPKWIGANLLDLSNKDTLRFSYSTDKNKPTAYLYKVIDDTLFVNSKAAYKILKVTDTELDLVNAFRNDSSRDGANNAFIMIYKVKKK
jgi:hypothetical protein